MNEIREHVTRSHLPRKHKTICVSSSLPPLLFSSSCNSKSSSVKDLATSLRCQLHAANCYSTSRLPLLHIRPSQTKCRIAYMERRLLRKERVQGLSKNGSRKPWRRHHPNVWLVPVHSGCHSRKIISPCSALLSALQMRLDTSNTKFGCTLLWMPAPPCHAMAASIPYPSIPFYTVYTLCTYMTAKRIELLNKRDSSLLMNSRNSTSHPSCIVLFVSLLKTSQTPYMLTSVTHSSRIQRYLSAKADDKPKHI